jgi:hypothetical protein
MTNKRTNMTMKQAIENGVFTRQYCSMCGKENCRLYVQNEGTYAGCHYCRSCATHALKQEHF